MIAWGWGKLIYNHCPMFLMPQQPDFFKYFKELSGHIQDMASLFLSFSKDFNDFENYHIRAKEIEKRADDVTHKMIARLNQSFIVPFDREDLYALTKKMDDLVDLPENVVNRIYLYEIKEKRPFVDDFARLIKRAADELDELIVEAFTKQKPTKRINDYIIKIHELEDQADTVYHDAIKRLFVPGQDPIDLIKWKDILENLEHTMDLFQNVSDLIEGTIVKSN